MVVSGIHVTSAHVTGLRVDVAALTALAEFPDTTPRGIAGVIARLVNSGELGGRRAPPDRARARRRPRREPRDGEPGVAGAVAGGTHRVPRPCGQLRAQRGIRSPRTADARDGGAERPGAARPLARHPRPAAAARARAGAVAGVGARRDRQLPGRTGDPRRSPSVLAASWPSRGRVDHGRRRRARRDLAHARAARALRRPRGRREPRLPAVPRPARRARRRGRARAARRARHGARRARPRAACADPSPCCCSRAPRTPPARR